MPLPSPPLFSFSPVSVRQAGDPPPSAPLPTACVICLHTHHTHTARIPPCRLWPAGAAALPRLLARLQLGAAAAAALSPTPTVCTTPFCFFWFWWWRPLALFFPAAPPFPPGALSFHGRFASPSVARVWLRLSRRPTHSTPPPYNTPPHTLHATVPGTLITSLTPAQSQTNQPTHCPAASIFRLSLPPASCLPPAAPTPVPHHSTSSPTHHHHYHPPTHPPPSGIPWLWGALDFSALRVCPRL